MIQQEAEPSFDAATQTYLAWMARYCALDEQGLKLKQAKMRDSPFAFLRGTFYRWSHHFAAVPDEVRSASSLLIVGDIHLENFGTWRDREGRLAWGINDFDEAAELPVTSDLVRLATSAVLEARREAFQLTAFEAADTILEGYWAHLKFGPEPFILEDRHAWLRDLAAATGNNARRHWRKLLNQKEVDEHTVPEEARSLLRSHLPAEAAPVRFFRRLAGLGSLGRPRFMAMAEWCGGLVAREAKAAIPSAVHAAVSEIADPTGPSRRVVEQACRAPDPVLHIGERWVVRRLSPEARKVEIDEVEHAPDQKHFLHAMGRELANVHLGSAGGAALIRSCLERLPDDWLRTASCLAAARVQEDYETFLRGS
jgi:uncharacterized protein (DUF2252 family)